MLFKINSAAAKVMSIVFSLFFIVVGLIFFLRFDPDAYDGVTTGTITHIEESRNINDDSTDYTVYIDYTAEGRDFRDVEYGSYNSSMREGDEVEVYYMTSAPENFTGSGKDAAPYIGLGFAVLGVVMLAFTVFKMIRRGV